MRSLLHIDFDGDGSGGKRLIAALIRVRGCALQEEEGRKGEENAKEAGRG